MRIRRILVVRADGQTQTLYREKSKKRKKGTPGLRQVERLLRRGVKANQSFTGTYLKRHDRSNRKRRDGWVRDLTVNLVRGQRKSMKSFRLRRLFG